MNDVFSIYISPGSTQRRIRAVCIESFSPAYNPAIRFILRAQRRHVHQIVGLGQKMELHSSLRRPHSLRHAGRLQSQGQQLLRLRLAGQNIKGVEDTRLRAENLVE